MKAQGPALSPATWRPSREQCAPDTGEGPILSSVPWSPLNNTVDLDATVREEAEETAVQYCRLRQRSYQSTTEQGNFDELQRSDRTRGTEQ